jgi:hypothetical protein
MARARTALASSRRVAVIRLSGLAWLKSELSPIGLSLSRRHVRRLD